MDMNSFYVGKCFDAYEFLGAHLVDNGAVFRTFAPSADGIVLIYEGQEIEMSRVYNDHFYEVYVEGAKPGDKYEYRIYKRDGSYTDHCDPYGFGMELRPDHKSIIRDLSEYKFHDEEWIAKRNDRMNAPVNIYEMHMGSWKKNEDEWYSYSQIADLLVPYLKENGYNYVEFLPLSEHPCDESWGYQNTGFYAPTSRYGTAKELMYLIDKLHENNIGAILDIVPVHFAVDDYGLSNYDGTALYEYPHQDVGVSEWGSCNFIYSRGEVRTFMQSSANYWLKEYHFDGLRMDAISRIIYWQGDENRGVNHNAVDFIKGMNWGLRDLNPGCILIAEDSTNYPKVTARVEYGGLGFDYKWDMGWMHDTLSYFQLDPQYRRENYHKLTFSMMYFKNENYLLPYSHDEVVHGKATILQKMNGDYEDKFPQGRAMYLYMMVHPGKKLNFMGNEFGQLREWDEKREQDWDILKYPTHDAFHKYMMELNKIYLEHPAMYEGDFQDDGFEWLDCHQEEKCLYAIQRKGGGECLAAIFNFGETTQVNYSIRMPNIDDARTILNTDWERFGGFTKEKMEITWVSKNALNCNIAPFSGVLVSLKFKEKVEEEEKISVKDDKKKTKK